MKTIIALIVIFFLPSIIFSQTNKRDTLIFGTDIYYPPYEFLNENGEPEGFNIDIVNELAREMNVEIIIKLDEWKKIRQGLEVDGTVDISDMFYSKTRDSLVDYAFPHDIIYNKVFLNKSSKPIIEITDLFGKRVAVLQGSILEEYLHAKFPEIQLVPKTTEREALQMVSENLCDAAIATNITGQAISKNQAIKNIVGYGNMIMPSEYCFVVKDGNSDLLKEINLALANLIVNGTIEKLRKKWFDEKIFGIRQIYVKVGFIAMFMLLVLIYLLNFSLKLRIRKRSSQLFSSEERWKFALEGAGDGVWDWNAETNEVFFSKQWKEMLGFTEDEIGNSLDEWDKRVHPDDKEKVYADLNNHFNRISPVYINEHRVLCKDGSFKWILDRGKVMQWAKDGKPKRVIGTHTDITERKKNEKELLYHQDLIREMEKVAKIGGWEFDVKTGKGSWTEEIAKIHDLNPKDETNVEIGLSFYTPESRIIIEKAIKDAIEKGQSYDLELELISAKGVHKWVHTIGHPVIKNGKVTNIHGSFQDITERKQTEELLKDSEKRFTQILQSVNLVSIIIETDATISFCNDYFLNITGYEKEEVIGKNWFDLFIPGFISKKIKKVFSDAVSKNTFVSFMENEIKTKNGELKTIAWNNTIIKNAKGEFQSIACLGEDISKRKMAEAELFKSNAFIRNIIEQSTTAMWISDKNGTLIQINPACCNLLNIKKEEVLDKYNVLNDNIVKEQGFLPQVEMVFKKGISTRFEIHYNTENLDQINLDGKKSVILDITIFPIKDTNGKVTNAVIQNIDITDRKIAEKEIRKLNEELEEKVKIRTQELETKISEIQRINNLFVGRELRMKELKDKIKILENNLKNQS